jgi:hypothetical protein
MCSSAACAADVPQQSGMDCALYAIDNIQHLVQLYGGVYSSGGATDRLPDEPLPKSLLHKPAKGPDGKPTMDAAGVTKLCHDILLPFALNAEELDCNGKGESCKHIQVSQIDIILPDKLRLMRKPS